VFGYRLRLVETLQGAIVTLVQAPVRFDWDPHTIHFVEHDPQRADRALENRGVGDVNIDTCFLNLTTSVGCFDTSLG
jgi:hypothetical protein